MTKELTVTCKKEILLRINNLNLLEQKLLFLVLSEIDPIIDNSSKTKLIKISKNFIKNILEINNNKFYEDIQKIINNLNFKKNTFVLDDKNESKKSFLELWRINSSLYQPNSIYIEVEIPPKLIAFFTDLKPPFVTIKLKHILWLKSKYSIWIYNLIKADLYKYTKYKHTLTYDVNLFNEVFKLTYNYKNLKRFVIKKALEEINEKTDIRVDFIENKVWRKVESISISILWNNTDIENKPNKWITYLNNFKKVKVLSDNKNNLKQYIYS